MTDAELADVVERTAALRAAQEAEDTPEAKATLPRLRGPTLARRAPSRRWSWTRPCPSLPAPRHPHQPSGLRHAVFRPELRRV
ncbi:MAG: hypothetical protein ACLTYW_10090 [Collinsella sp.]